MVFFHILYCTADSDGLGSHNLKLPVRAEPEHKNGQVLPNDSAAGVPATHGSLGRAKPNGKKNRVPETRWLRLEKALQRGEPLKLLSFAQLESLIDMGLPALHLCRPSAVCFARRSPVLSRTL